MQTLSTAWLPSVGPRTRMEYVRLPRDLAALTNSFGITLPWRAQRDAAILTFCIECADRLLDALPKRGRRERVGVSVGLHLRGGFPFNEEFDPGLAGRPRPVG